MVASVLAFIKSSINSAHHIHISMYIPSRGYWDKRSWSSEVSSFYSRMYLRMSNSKSTGNIGIVYKKSNTTKQEKDWQVTITSKSVLKTGSNWRRVKTDVRIIYYSAQKKKRCVLKKTSNFHKLSALLNSLNATDLVGMSYEISQYAYPGATIWSKQFDETFCQCDTHTSCNRSTTTAQ